MKMAAVKNVGGRSENESYRSWRKINRRGVADKRAAADRRAMTSAKDNEEKRKTKISKDVTPDGHGIERTAMSELKAWIMRGGRKTSRSWQ
jgi:hypothetical protein